VAEKDSIARSRGYPDNIGAEYPDSRDIARDQKNKIAIMAAPIFGPSGAC